MTTAEKHLDLVAAWTEERGDADTAGASTTVREPIGLVNASCRGHSSLGRP
jgi:hypothetical protein